jgi:Transglutaminase-like superfamily
VESFYASQSTVTSPGNVLDRLADLPRDVAGIQRVARGLVLHYRGEDPLGHGIAEERLSEIDTRYADAMLARLAELDDRLLAEARPPTKRLIGCCRDFTVLFLTMAREAGIPARARIGFATYFFDGYRVDHEVAEVWDGSSWRLVDPQLHDEHVDPNDGATVDPLDVPRDRFVVGGAAWRQCREGKADPETFVVSPDLELEVTRSWPYLRHNLVLDLAGLNKDELILWDSWGLIEADDPAADDVELLDEIASVTSSADPELAELRRLYESEGVRAPATVTSYDPLGGPPRRLTLRRPGVERSGDGRT